MTDTLYIFYNQQQEFICETTYAALWVTEKEKDLIHVLCSDNKQDLEALKENKEYWKCTGINIDDFIITPIKLRMELV
jgi:hypothetical protein